MITMGRKLLWKTGMATRSSTFPGKPVLSEKKYFEIYGYLRNSIAYLHVCYQVFTILTELHSYHEIGR